MDGGNGISERGTPGPGWIGWLGIGLAGTGLIIVAVVTITGGVTWISAAELVVATAVMGVVIARSSLDLSSLLQPTSAPVTPWRWQPSVPPQRVALGATATVAIGWAMYVAYDRWPGPVGWNVGGPWLAGMLLAGVCAWWPNLGWPDWVRPSAWTREESVGWGLVGGVALATRLVWPGEFPSIVDGDEGVFLRMAREARAGVMTNPFASGWFEVPNLYPAVMGWLSPVTGDTLGGLRMLMALIGTVTVVATWRLGRQVVGPEAALVGALLLAVMPFYLIFTRTALFHGTDPAALMLGLLFLHRAVRTNRAGDAWLAGVMVGLGWYGYWGARSLPIVVALILLLTARPFWRVVTLGGWAATGFLVTIAPLIVTFVQYRPAFSGRIAMTSITIKSEWQENPVQAVLTRLRSAAFRPFIENVVVFYRHEAPLIGWPDALLLVLGGAGLGAALIRTRAWRTVTWLVVPVLVLMGVLGAVDVVEAHRLLMVTPIWALVIGIGVVVLARWVVAIPIGWWSGRAVVMPVAMGLAGLLMVANLSWVYSNDRIVANWGDPRTTAAWDLGWRVGDGPSPPEVLLAGPPFVFANSNPAFMFEAPHAVMTEILEPMEDVSDVPLLDTGQVLVVVPERLPERCVLDAALPDALVFDVRAADHTLLYVVYGMAPVPGWSISTSPAGTTAMLVGQATCGEAH